MKTLTGCVCAFLLVAALTGCQTSVNTIENQEKYATPNHIVDKRYVTDGFLKDRLALRGVITDETSDGLLRVQVTATNVRVGAWSSSKPYNVDYKFVWLDAAGMQVETNLSIWQTMRIQPGETVYFKSVAPRKNAKDFVLNLRESK